MAQFINPPLLPVAHEYGSFLGSFLGFASATSSTVNWEILGNVAYLSIAGFTGISNEIFFVMELPANLVPELVTQTVPLYGITDNDSDIYLGVGAFVAGNTLVFEINGDSDGFTNSGTKGLPVQTTLSYLLKDFS